MTALVKDNLEPLLVNTKNSRVNRPSAATQIPNFVVASDYVLTETDLACMEAANEAARHAVNAVLAATGSSKPPCTIHALQEPEIFRVMQAADELEYKVNPAQSPLLCRMVDLLLAKSAPVGGLPGGIAPLILGTLSAITLGLVLYQLFTR
jgi:hypothetical protein